MKKTLLVITALAGISEGADYTALYTGADVQTTTAFGFSSENASVAITLDVDALKECLNSTWVNGTATVTSIVKMTGTWNGDGNIDGYVGIDINGSSTSKYGTFYGEGGSPSKNIHARAIKFDGLSEQVKFNSSTNWDNFESITLVLTYDNNSILSAYYTAALADGSSSVLSGSTSSILFTIDTVGRTDLMMDSVTVNTDLVKAVAIYNSALSADEAKAVGVNMLTIPEPTTATLSLLALAGLAARRRRK